MVKIYSIDNFEPGYFQEAEVGGIKRDFRKWLRDQSPFEYVMPKRSKVYLEALKDKNKNNCLMDRYTDN